MQLDYKGKIISAQNKGELLSIVELGGYPDFSSLYKQAGFEVEKVDSVRKAVRVLKKLQPVVIVAEFNFQSDFRDRTSSLETLMAVVQRMPETKVIVFFEQEYSHQFDKIRSRFPIYAAFPFPIDSQKLENTLKKIS